MDATIALTQEITGPQTPPTPPAQASRPKEPPAHSPEPQPPAPQAASQAHSTPPTAAEPTQGAGEPQGPEQPQDKVRLWQMYLNRAAAGDRTAIPHLQELFDRNPQNWRETMSLVGLWEGLWIRRLGSNQPLFEEALRRQVKELKQQMLGPAPGILERVLVDRITTLWLQVECVEQQSFGSEPSLNLQLERLKELQLESSNRRLLEAVKTLAQVRRLEGVKLGPSVPGPGGAEAGEPQKLSGPVLHVQQTVDASKGALKAASSKVDELVEPKKQDAAGTGQKGPVAGPESSTKIKGASVPLEPPGHGVG